MRIKKIVIAFTLILLLAFLSFNNVYANWYLDGSGGITWARGEDGQIIVTEGVGGETDTLKQESVDNGYVYHLGGGYSFPLFFCNSGTGKKLSNQPNRAPFKKILLGVDGYYSPNRQITGTTYQYGDSNFDNYKFYMDVRSYRLMLTAREIINVPERFRIEPYLLEGIGVSWNTIDNFKEIAASGIPGGDYYYNQRTHSSFAYQLGLGISFLINKHFNVYAEYDYLNAGEIRSSNDYQSGSMIQGVEFKLKEEMLFLGIHYNFS